MTNGIDGMKDLNLRELLIQKIHVLYDIESELVKALAKMAKASTDSDLKKGFRDHLEETKNQVVRLEKIHEILGSKPKKLKSEAIRGLIKDGSWVMKNIKPKKAMDVNLIRAAQYVEHYEMAGYLGAITWARELGEGEVESLLLATYQEEEATNKKLDNLGKELDQAIL